MDQFPQLVSLHVLPVLFLSVASLSYNPPLFISLLWLLSISLSFCCCCSFVVFVVVVVLVLLILLLRHRLRLLLPQGVQRQTWLEGE